MIRTPDQRVRVFVSSTLGELAAEPPAVRESGVCLLAGDRPPARMISIMKCS